jgi:hypothetical protein
MKGCNPSLVILANSRRTAGGFAAMLVGTLLKKSLLMRPPP